MGWESFGVIGFDLWPLFQGQMNLLIWSDFTLGFSFKVKRVRMALVSFLLVDTICIGFPMR